MYVIVAILVAIVTTFLRNPISEESPSTRITIVTMILLMGIWFGIFHLLAVIILENHIEALVGSSAYLMMMHCFVLLCVPFLATIWYVAISHYWETANHTQTGLQDDG